MALLDSDTDIECNVTIDATNLQEYPDDDHEQAPRAKSVYIQAQSNMHFGFRFKVKKNTNFRGDALLFAVTFDGSQTLALDFLVKSDMKKDFSGIIDDCIVSKFQGQSFQFSAERLRIAHSRSGSTLLPELGTISVTIHHVKLENQLPLPKEAPWQSPVLLGFISEEAEEMGGSASHVIEMGGETEYECLVLAQDFHYVDPSKQPHATFNFKYRSLSTLMSMFVVPNNLSRYPSDAIEHRNAASLSLREIEALQLFKATNDSEKTESRSGDPINFCYQSGRAVRPLQSSV